MRTSWLCVPLLLLAAPRCQSASDPITNTPEPPAPPTHQPPSPPQPPPPPPPGAASFVACEGLPSPVRTVTVANDGALRTALLDARAGDRIVLAPGTYPGTKKVTDRSGTASQPIVLCGPKTAVLTGDFRSEGLSWWIFQGFTMRDAFQAFYAKGMRNSRVQGVEIFNVDQEAVHFLCNSTDNVLESSYIHDTGRTKPSSGEGVYLGTYPGNLREACQATEDRSDRNQVLNNRFGPNVPSEDVDAKEGTSRGIIRGNISNGQGKLAISGHFEASIAIKSETWDYVVQHNTLQPAAQDGSAEGNGIYVYGGSGHQIQDNTIDMTGAGGYGIKVNGGGSVSCDNAVIGGTLSNVSCR